MDLTVGRLDDELSSMASAACDALKVDGSVDWRNAREDIATIPLFNLASVHLFNEHVSKLPEYSESRFRNLTWWENSIWLPIDFSPPADPVIEENGWPISLGSSLHLLSELDEVRRLSPLALGASPPGYEAMRSNLKEFYRSHFEVNDDVSIIRWIWKGLYDAAEIGIREAAPIWGAS